MLRVDAAGADRELWSGESAPYLDRGGRRAARAVDECEPTVGPEEETKADVPARYAAVRVVQRVDLAVAVAGAARRLDRLDQHVPRDRSVRHAGIRHTIVVLDLLDRQEIRRAEVVHDDLGVTRKCRPVTRVQVLDVVCSHRDLVDGRRRGHLAGKSTVDGGEGRGDVELEVAEAVV